MKRRTFHRTVLAFLAAAALFSIQASAGKPVASASDTTIANGVYVEGVDLSGMTPEQAKDECRFLFPLSVSFPSIQGFPG